MQDTPSISTSCYSTSNVNPIMLFEPMSLTAGQKWDQFATDAAADCIRAFQPRQTQTTETTSMPNQTQRRYVQVFIADPNENVPLEESVLYKGDQKLTDLTDTELFFEVPIAETLKAHNEKRVKWLDKEASKRAGKDVTLDAVKIRDLKMVVVTIAAF